jgi:hypothetical protein
MKLLRSVRIELLCPLGECNIFLQPRDIMKIVVDRIIAAISCLPSAVLKSLIEPQPRAPAAPDKYFRQLTPNVMPSLNTVPYRRQPQGPRITFATITP